MGCNIVPENEPITIIESIAQAFPDLDQEQFTLCSAMELEDYFDLFDFADGRDSMDCFAGALCEVISRWKLGQGQEAGLLAVVAIGDYLMQERPSPGSSAKPTTLTKDQERALCLFVREVAKRPEATTMPLVQITAEYVCPAE